MQVNARHHTNQQLRDVLHIVATQPDAGTCVSSILQIALQIGGVVGAAFRSAEPGAISAAVGDSSPLEVEAAALDFASIDPASGALVCAVADDDGSPLGVLWLNTEPDFRMTSRDRDLLASLVDGLLIVLMREQTQRRASQSDRLVQSLLESMTDPLLVFDEDWRLMTMNPTAETLFGMNGRAARGASLSDIVQSDELTAFALRAAALDEWSRGTQVFAPRIQTIIGSEDQPPGTILYLRDITRYKRLSKSQHEFLRIVSHDVRSTLTPIDGFARMLGTVGALNEKQNLFVDKIANGVTQITNLVDNIQDAGRYDPETGFYEMKRAPLDLRTMVERIVKNHLIPAEKQELTLSCAVDEDVPLLNADATMIERGITNLVVNAINYTPNGGKVDVLVSVKDKSVVISVRDNGFGISPENQKKLFQRHVRIDRKEHKKVRGTGLGLFIVRSVAQRHGGDAWVESAENEGSTFSFNIPLKGANLVTLAKNAR